MRGSSDMLRRLWRPGFLSHVQGQPTVQLEQCCILPSLVIILEGDNERVYDEA